MKRLRPEKPLILYYTPPYVSKKHNIIFHNSRSLHAHYKYVATDPNFLACDVIGIAETRLNNQQIMSKKYSFDGFETHANSVDNSNAPHHGLATYIKPDITPFDTLHFHSEKLEFTVHLMPHHFSPPQVAFFLLRPEETHLAFFKNL